MPNIQIPADRGRSNFLRAAGQVAKMMGLPTVEALLEQYKVYDSELKMPMLLQPGTTSYTFNPVTGITTPVPGEIKIQKNDWFAVTGVGLRFTRAAYASSNGTLSNYGNYDEYTFPYASIFTGAGIGAGATEANCMLTVVRGNIGLSVNNDEQWRLPCKTLTYTNQQLDNDSPETIVFGPGSEAQGLFQLNGIIILNGGVDNLLTLNLLNGDTSNIDGNNDDAGTTRNLVMPVLQGILIKNVANGGYSAALCRA